MSSSALPPLTGAGPGGPKDDREDQRTQKVKPLPLMLSSRAPLVQAAAGLPTGLRSGSPGQTSTSTRGGRSGAGPSQSQQPSQQPPHHLYQTLAAADAPPSPGSPTAQQTPQRSSNKFTRIRGFQGTTPALGLEGSGLLQPLGPGGRPGSNATGQQQQQQQQQGSGGGGSGAPTDSGAGQGQAPHHSWDGGSSSSPGLGTSPPQLTSGGRLLGAGNGGSSGGTGLIGEAWQQAHGGGGSGSGGGAPPNASWAARRSGLLMGERSGGSHSRGREMSPLDSPGASALILGPHTTGLSLAAVGNAPLGTRLINSAATSKPFSMLAPASTAPGRPDTAPSSPSLEPLSTSLAPRVNSHTLGHSYGHGLPMGLVAPAAINPPLHLPSAWPPPNGIDATSGPGLLHPPPLREPNADHGNNVPAAAATGDAAVAANAAAGSSSEVHSPQRQLLPPQSQPMATAAQLLQRLYRTNRTPPSQTESLQDLLNTATQQHVSTIGPGSGPVGDGRGGRALGGVATADTSRAASPSPLGPSGGGGGALPQPSGSRSAGGAAPVPITSLSGGLASSIVSRPGTTNTVSSSLANSLLNRPKGRNAAAGTLADLSAALQKSIAAGMGEWDLRADGTWGHPEIQQRLLKGPLGPEALKNRYRMQERDIISLYRLLYSYSVGFFTDVESLLDIAVSDRNSGAAVGLKAGTSLRQELLENVFRAYATLWDEALMIVFDSEMTSMLADKNAALRALDRGAVELEAMKREKNELQTRLDDFMKQNVDNMLASRHLQQAATKLEGEVYTLHNANEQLVTNMARHAVHLATLERQLDAARAATQAAETRAVAAEAHLHDLKAIISEQNATLSSQFFQIKELERMCSELQETVRNLNRRRAAVLGLLSGNSPDQSDPGAIASGASPANISQRANNASGLAGTSSKVLVTGSGGASVSGSSPAQAGTGDGGAGLDGTTEGVMADLSLLDPDELGRLLSDKTRAFNLMHADFVVKMHELDEQRASNEALRQEVAAMKEEVRKSLDAAVVSDRTAAHFRAKFEAGRMSMEDLEEKNRKLTHKNAELVRSYWPLMTRLKEAEAEATRCREEAARDREQAAKDREEADQLRAEAVDTRAALQELEERRAEAASHELELPADVVALLPEGQVVALRRFARSCHRRVAHLNSQVVALVDQVTQARLQSILNKEQQVLQGSGVGSTLSNAESVISAALAEATSLRSAVANRDKWLAVLTKSMSALMSQMENLMARDWETCRTLRLEQDRRKQRAAREAKRALARQASRALSGADSGTVSGSTLASPERSAVSVGMNSNHHSLSGGTSVVAAAAPSGDAAVGGSDASPVVEPTAEMALADQPQIGPAVPTGVSTFDASITPTPLAGSELSATSLSQQAAAAAVIPDNDGDGQQQQQQPPQQESSQHAGSAADNDGDDDNNKNNDGEGGGADDRDGDDDGDGDEGMTVAAGRLAQMVGVSSSADDVERSPQLLALDRVYDRLADSAERLIEWSEGLLKRKEQTATFTQIRQKLETVTRQLDSASLELTTLKPAAEALRHANRGYEIKFKDMSISMATLKQRAETAESRLESVEAQLSVVTQQLREAQDAQKLLENEYWKAKDIALDAEVNSGELKAGRLRALEAAAKALASVSGLQKEARENRDQRVALEADLVGYKAWVRHMEAIERKHRATLLELADVTGSCEERDRKLGELKDRITTLEQQLRFKSIETASLESRVKALSGELVEERRAARMAVAAARGSTAVQLDTAIRQAGAAEAEAAARRAQVDILEARLTEVSHELDEAQAAAAAAEARLVPLTAERDRLRAHIAASQPLLQAINRAAEAMDRRLTLLENVATAETSASGSSTSTGKPHVRFGVPAGSLEFALEALFEKVDGALDACAAVAAEAAGDATPALLGALEGLVVQLLSTLSKGGKEPIQSVAVLKAQLARDDKELAALRAAMVEVRTAADEAAREAAEQRTAAAAAATAAAAAVAAAARDSRRAMTAESALMAARRDLDTATEELSDARLAAERATRQAERSQKRAAELEADTASAHSQRRHYEALAVAAQEKCAELKRRGDELEEEGLRDQDAAREARERADAAEAVAAAAQLRCSELEAAVEAEKREAARLRADAEVAVAAAAAARDKAVAVEQDMLEMQAKYADMIRHDESIEERLRQAQFEAENMRKKAEEAMADAAEVNAQYEALQQRAWQLQVALQAKHGEKEEVLRGLVEATHGTVAKKGAAAALGSASVKQRAEGTHETASSFKAKRTDTK